MTHWHTPEGGSLSETGRRKAKHRAALNSLLAQVRVDGERAAYTHAYGLAQRTDDRDELLDMLRALSQGNP